MIRTPPKKDKNGTKDEENHGKEENKFETKRSIEDKNFNVKDSKKIVIEIIEMKK